MKQTQDNDSLLDEKAVKSMLKIINNYYSPNLAETQEQTLIGYLLIDSSIVSAVDEIIITKEVFSDTINQAIYQTIKTMVTSLKNQNINSEHNIMFSPDEIYRELLKNINIQEHERLTDLGGNKYLVKCIEQAGAFNRDKALTTAKNVRDKYEKRVITNRLTELITKVQHADNEQGEASLSVLKSQLMELQIENNQGLRSPSSMVDEYLEEFSDLFFGNKNDEYLNTGFTALDKLLGGLHSDDLIIIGARPSMGKTMFSLNIVNNIIQQDPSKKILFFSLEMSFKKLYNRLIANRIRIENNKLKDIKHLSNDDYEKVSHAVNQFRHENLYIDDNDGTVLDNIKSRIQNFVNEHNGIDLLVVDYLQLIDSLNSGNDKLFNRERLISEVSRELKKIAKKYHIPVIALVQLSRNVEQRQDKRPLLSDIRESGAIEQDADVVMFLYRDDYYERKNKDEIKKTAKDMLPKTNPFDETFTPNLNGADDEIVFDETDKKDAQEELFNSESEVSELEVIVAKNRDGGVGTVKLLADLSYSSITDIFTVQPKE